MHEEYPPEVYGAIAEIVSIGQLALNTIITEDELIDDMVNAHLQDRS